MRTYNLQDEIADDHDLIQPVARPPDPALENSSYERDAAGFLRPKLTADEAIRIIQRNERGRQARHRFRVIRDIRCVLRLLSLSLSLPSGTGD